MDVLTKKQQTGREQNHEVSLNILHLNICSFHCLIFPYSMEVAALHCARPPTQHYFVSERRDIRSGKSFASKHFSSWKQRDFCSKFRDGSKLLLCRRQRWFLSWCSMAWNLFRRYEESDKSSGSNLSILHDYAFSFEFVWCVRCASHALAFPKCQIGESCNGTSRILDRPALSSPVNFIWY